MPDPAAVDRGDARPTRSPGLTFVGLLLGAVLAAVLLDQAGRLADPDPSRRPPAAVAATSGPDLPAATAPDMPIVVQSIRRCPVKLGGLALGDRRQAPQRALERWGCSALKGPWAVVIRATDGHFGAHGAVVTFPVNRGWPGTAVTKPRGAVWNPSVRLLVWPLAGSYAQIVGDVGQPQLADLAMRITVEAGKPHLGALDGFTARQGLQATTFHPSVVHEMRYSTTDLGQEDKLRDGLVFTGLMAGASLESQALAARAKPAGFVRGQPAIYSEALGDAGTLAWESAPGEVAYIGFSGFATQADAMTQTDAVEALRALADKGRLLTPAQWQTTDRISVGGW